MFKISAIQAYTDTSQWTHTPNSKNIYTCVVSSIVVSIQACCRTESNTPLVSEKLHLCLPYRWEAEDTDRWMPSGPIWLIQTLKHSKAGGFSGNNINPAWVKCYWSFLSAVFWRFCGVSHTFQMRWVREPLQIAYKCCNRSGTNAVRVCLSLCVLQLYFTLTYSLRIVCVRCRGVVCYL